MAFTCYYYRSESGRVPVKDFINSLDLRAKQKFFFVRGLLEEFGRKLHEPYSKYIGSDIFELRFKGQEGHIRVLYFFFYQDKVIFTNGFVKKADRTPKTEKMTAIERKNSFYSRVRDGQEVRHE